MNNILQRFAIKFIIIAFFVAILMSFFIFYIYNSINVKKEIGLLDIEENNILNRYGLPKGKSRFCAYPEISSCSQIIWSEEKYSQNKSVKITFKNNDVNCFSGIHLHLTIIFSPYLEKGILEFWIRGGINSSLINNLGVYLKEGPIIQRMVKVSLPIAINKNWQRISITINSFQLVKEYDDINKEFTWAIQEVLFSINPLNSNQSAEFFIAGLKILNDNQIIYELF